MMVDFAAGQVLTADDLLGITSQIVRQGADQDVTSSTTLVDSSIVVPVDGLTVIRLRARCTPGGGIRWAWSASGSVSGISRTVLSAGQTTAAAIHNIADMRWRSLSDLTEEQDVQMTTSLTSPAIGEDLLVEGSGDLTFQFAQETSSATATTLDAQSYAEYVGCREP